MGVGERMSRHAIEPFHLLVVGLLIASALGIVYLRGQPARSLARREAAWHDRIQPGDVIFQDLDCGIRCDLIREVTHSPYTHVGLVLEENGQRVVWEAYQPVGSVPLLEFIERGRDRLLAVYRPTPELLAKLPQVAEQVRAMRGRPYDGNYQWDDDNIYCSELIEKGFERGAGVALFPPHPLGPGSFGVHAGVIKKISDGKLTEQTPLTSPLDLTRSPSLHRIVDELEGSLH
jgi:hypothetical protein